MANVIGYKREVLPITAVGLPRLSIRSGEQATSSSATLDYEVRRLIHGPTQLAAENSKEVCRTGND